MLDIPFEEFFFFIIQTYMTSLLYLLLSKPVFHPAFLQSKSDPRIERKRNLGLAIIIGIFSTAVVGLRTGGSYTYLSLILAWATPVLAFLW
jgi:15-cis-phytoene synthase/lycopene beta-cyclase